MTRNYKKCLLAQTVLTENTPIDVFLAQIAVANLEAWAVVAALAPLRISLEYKNGEFNRLRIIRCK